MREQLRQHGLADLAVGDARQQLFRRRIERQVDGRFLGRCNRFLGGHGSSLLVGMGKYGVCLEHRANTSAK